MKVAPSKSFVVGRRGGESGGSYCASLVAEAGLTPAGGLRGRPYRDGTPFGTLLGGEVIGAVPLSRWDVEGGDPLASGPAFGGFLPGVELFDPGLFGLSPAEATVMDPQQR